MNRSRIKFVYRKITGIDYKNMFRVLNREADNNGKSRLWVKFDFVRCALKYKMGYIDYMKGHYGYWHKEISKVDLLKLFNVEGVSSYKDSAQFKRGVLDVAHAVKTYETIVIHAACSFPA